MSALAEFLLQCIAEDEKVAKAASYMQEPWAKFCSTYLPHRGEMYVHARWWPPERVLAECEAKRRIIEVAEIDDATVPTSSAYRILELLALPYADHPDFREEWRP